MRRIRRTAIIGGVAATALVVAVTPAEAHPYTNAYNWGCDHSHPNCTHATTHVLSTSGVGGNVVALWQSILYQQQLLPCADIDGVFGSQTETETKKYQNRFGESQDGAVGQFTYNTVQFFGGATDNWAVLGPLGGGLYEYAYDPNFNGPEIDLMKNSNPGGTWKFSAPWLGSGSWYTTDHGSSVSNTC